MISLATVSNAFKPSYALETSNTLKTFKALNRPEAPQLHSNQITFFAVLIPRTPSVAMSDDYPRISQSPVAVRGACLPTNRQCSLASSIVCMVAP